jgi:hypothetical protein
LSRDLKEQGSKSYKPSERVFQAKERADINILREEPIGLFDTDRKPLENWQKSDSLTYCYLFNCCVMNVLQESRSV